MSAWPSKPAPGAPVGGYERPKISWSLTRCACEQPSPRPHRILLGGEGLRFCANCGLWLPRSTEGDSVSTPEDFATESEAVMEIRDGIAKLRRERDEAADEIERLRGEAAVLRERVEKLEADARRLDWLERTPFTAYRDGDCKHFTVVDEAQRKRERYGNVAKTLRQALDEAMARATPDSAVPSPDVETKP